MRPPAPQNTSPPHAHRATSPHLLELDGLRGVAILMVMAYHLWPPGGNSLTGRVVAGMCSKGWSGVDVFFALSGFLITGILLDSRDSARYWWNFYVRRSLRIFPLYYFVTTMLVVAAFSASYAGLRVSGLDPQTMKNVWTNYLYLTNITITFCGHDWAPMSIAWSLAMEEQYYLVFPWLVWMARPRTVAWVLICVVLAAPIIRILAFYGTDSNYLVPYSFPLCRMDGIAFGGLVALLVRSSRTRIATTSNLLALSAPLLLGIAVALLWRYDRADSLYVLVGYSLPAAATGALILGIRQARYSSVSAFLRWRPLVNVGCVSYGLYLYHMPVKAAVDMSFHRFGWENTDRSVYLDGFRVLVAFTSSMMVAMLSWRFFESPILSWKERLAPRAEPSLSNSAASRIS